MKKLYSQILIALVCILLGYMLAYQFKKLNIQEKKIYTQGSLGSAYDITVENERLKTVIEQLEKENNNVITELKKYETEATSSNRLAQDIQTQLQDSRIMLGLTDVEGPGIVIYLTPKSSIFNKEAMRYVNYEEVVYLINELFFAGAEAVSVNDNRIVSQSVVKSINNNEFVLVNDDKISPKKRIMIKVIGDKGKLNDAMNFPGILDYEALADYDVNIQQSDHIEIDKYNKPYKDEFLRPVEN
jgi:uncharacterized protein YlxW (UPF0749 family)